MESAGAHGFPRICGELELPLVLVDLSTLHVLAASRVVLRRLDMTPDEVIGRPVLDLLLPEDRPKAISALQALDAGVVDFYRVHRPIPAAAGSDVSGRSGSVPSAWTAPGRR